MKRQLIAFRCPVNMLEMVDRYCHVYGVDRTTILRTAIRHFSEHIRHQGGNITSNEVVSDFAMLLQQEQARNTQNTMRS